jgi:hypothetical protein
LVPHGSAPFRVPRGGSGGAFGCAYRRRFGPYEEDLLNSMEATMSWDLIAGNATLLLSSLSSGGLAAVEAIIHATNSGFAALRACDLHVYVYGTLAGIMFVEAWHAWKERQSTNAHKHCLYGFLHAILAFLYLSW